MAKSIAAAILLIVLFAMSVAVAGAINHVLGSDVTPYQLIALSAAYQATKNSLSLKLTPAPIEESDDE